MKALMATAVWDPRPGYAPSARELERRRADCASQVWRDPSFALAEVAVPEIGDTEVLVRVVCCGICGSDSHLYQTDAEGYLMFSGPAALPCIIGHEYAGVVERVGRAVRGLREGDLVAAESIVWCGCCTPCRSGAFNQCDRVELTGITTDGALAEYVAVDERQCWSIAALAGRYDDTRLFEVAALIEPLGCAYNGLFVCAGGFRPGAVVVVHGAGPIGLGAIALARLAGASQVIAFDPIVERLAIAETLGADRVYDTAALRRDGVRPRDLVLEHTAGRGAEIQVEAAGAAGETVPEMQSSLAPGGQIVYLGRAATETPVQLNGLVSGANAIQGGRGHAGYGIYDGIIRLLASGRLEVAPMITARYPFAEAISALATSVQRTDGKVMVRIG
ncbi:scyllo-inosose 3-dehydrogenase [Marichromatium sp. AB31]|uniref:scyllo-inosose 3-dehydrogenase n=1 Tax=Marichromatium sp. AB31 TaxID=2483362 RepID=UPI000F40E86E|nr:scyllo-inosose 3-dehydrogenase [Marichromatium sp. AB31]RNE89103.1 alcohol dehydrogenase [Marichromatium sp. AB31]